MRLPGLLDQEDPTNSAGLIDAMLPGGLDPISLMLRRAMGGASDGKAGGQPVSAGAPGGAPGPTPPAQPPAQPPAAAPEPPSPIKKDPNLSPFRAGAVTAGMQLLQDSSTPTPYKQDIGSLLARALAAGVPAFVASKQLKAQREEGIARRREYLSMLQDPEVAKVLGPAGTRLAANMDAEKGIEYITKLMEEQGKTHVVGRSLVGADGRQIYRDVDPMTPVAENTRLYETNPDGSIKRDAQGNPVLIVDRAAPQRTPENMDGRSAALAWSLGLDPDRPETWTPEQRAEFNAELNKDSSNRGVNVSTTVQAGERAIETAVQGGIGASLVEGGNAIREQAPSYLAATNAIEILDSGNVTMGSAAEFRNSLGNLLVTSGLAPQGVKDKVVATQQFLGGAYDLTSRLVKRLGSGNGITEKDVQFMQKTVGADLSNQPEAARYLLDLQRRAIQADAIAHNKRVMGTQGLSDQGKANALVDLTLFGLTPEEAARRAMMDKFGNVPDGVGGGGGGGVGPAGPSVQTQFNGRTVEAKWDASLGKYIYTDSQGRKFEAAPR